MGSTPILLLRGCLGFCGVALCVFASEALYAASRVHKLLLSGKEGMAGGADFNADVALVSGTGNKRISAGAMHADLTVAWMDSCFHDGF